MPYSVKQVRRNLWRARCADCGRDEIPVIGRNISFDVRDDLCSHTELLEPESAAGLDDGGPYAVAEPRGAMQFVAEFAGDARADPADRRASDLAHQRMIETHATEITDATITRHARDLKRELDRLLALRPTNGEGIHLQAAIRVDARNKLLVFMTRRVLPAFSYDRCSSSMRTPSGVRRKAMWVPGRASCGSVVKVTPLALSSVTVLYRSCTVMPK